MSTQAVIAFKVSDNEYHAITLWHDGYPQFVKPILLGHYQDPSKIMQLMQVGNLTWLAPQIGLKIAGEENWDKNKYQCISLYRDRGRKEDAPSRFANRQSLLNWIEKERVDYFYIYLLKQKKWYYCPWSGETKDIPSQLIPLDHSGVELQELNEVHQTFPNTEQLAIMKGILDGNSINEIAKQSNITIKEATNRLNVGMKVANLKNMYDLVVWGLTTGIIQDPPRTELAKSKVDKGFPQYPIWLRVLQAMTTNAKDSDIAEEAGVSQDSLNYYKKLIQQKFLLGENPITLIRFAFQVVKPISPPAKTLGWKPEGITGTEAKVMHLIGQAYNTKEIAEMLNISVRTVYSYVREIKNKLNISSRGNETYSELSNLILQKLPHLADERPKKLSGRTDMIKGLTDRQMQMLKLLIQHKNRHQIATELNISLKTVEYHRDLLFQSLGINNRADLIALAKKYNLGDPTEEEQEPLVEMPLITKKGKNLYADDQLLRSVPVQTVRKNIVFIRESRKDSSIREGWTLVYFMDSDESAHAMAHGDLPYLLVPIGTWPRGSPILDVWKKKFQKPGHEHILGILQGNTNPDGIFLEMLTVRPGYQRNSIAQKMVDLLRQEFPEAEVSHSLPTKKGRSFLKKNQLLEPRYQTPEDRADIERGLDEGFHDSAKLEAFFYPGDVGYAFWFFRNGVPAGEIQMVGKDGTMFGFGVQRSLQRSGLGRAMLKYVFEKTKLQQLTFGSTADAFYHKVGAERKHGHFFILDQKKFKPGSLSFKDISKEEALKYLQKGIIDPWPSKS